MIGRPPRSPLFPYPPLFRSRERRLAKRALDLPATELPAATPGWPGEDPDLLEQVEDRLALELHLEPGELFLDFPAKARSEEHTSELQSPCNLVCRLLLEKKK